MKNHTWECTTRHCNEHYIRTMGVLLIGDDSGCVCGPNNHAIEHNNLACTTLLLYSFILHITHYRWCILYGTTL